MLPAVASTPATRPLLVLALLLTGAGFLSLGAGCGATDEGATDGGITDASLPFDGGANDGGGGDAGTMDGGNRDAGSTDAGADDAGPSDAGDPTDGGPIDPPCGCGAGEHCDLAGLCQAGPGPTGAPCTPNATCLPGAPSYPSCLDSQCESSACAAATQGVILQRDACTRACNIYQDDVHGPGLPGGDGVNDLDAPASDCRPAPITEGPAGTGFRCVNLAAPGQPVTAYCLPGTHFSECATSADCPADEVCDLGNRGGVPGTYCYAPYRENTAWPGAVVRLGQTCNRDPAAGPLVYCADGPCLPTGFCSAYCTATAGCDTTAHTPGQRCLSSNCENDATRACSVDADCSTAVCAGSIDLGGGWVFEHCTPRP